MVDIRLPNITADTQAGRTAQIQSYLHQLVEQLNWAFNNISEAQNGNGGNGSLVVVNAQNTALTPQEAKSTFDAIKGLIIKSSDIITAYSDEMKREYDGRYAASSDYGDYTETTNAKIIESSTRIDTLFAKTKEINGTITAIRSSEAYIRTGELETGVYGVEVGTTTSEGDTNTFKRWARFTADGIYFYLPTSTDPIAYMTGTKLVITNAEIKTLKLGGYIVDTENGIAFKWAGR